LGSDRIGAFRGQHQLLLSVGYRNHPRRRRVSVGSLYQYFPNRQALITACKRRSPIEAA
jgi:hypothetical protein